MTSIDDIEDDSQLRRGAPGQSPSYTMSRDSDRLWKVVAHKIYGIPQTINSANYVYFLAYQELASLRTSSSVELDKMVTSMDPSN
jgi:geranylgeranyl diphosphate synthase, type III